MDLEDYYKIYTYLNTLQVPEDSTVAQQVKLQRQASQYIIKDNILFWKNKRSSGPALRVVKTTELERVLHESHADVLAGHFGVEGTYNKAKVWYYWPSMYKTIVELEMLNS